MKFKKSISNIISQATPIIQSGGKGCDKTNDKIKRQSIMVLSFMFSFTLYSIAINYSICILS